MNNHNERRTVLSTQDEFEKKFRETHDAMLENLAHLPELAESYEVYKVGDDSTPVWRLGDLVSYFAPIQDTRLYSRYPVFRDDGHGGCVATKHAPTHSPPNSGARWPIPCEGRHRRCAAYPSIWIYTPTC